MSTFLNYLNDNPELSVTQSSDHEEFGRHTRRGGQAIGVDQLRGPAHVLACIADDTANVHFLVLIKSLDY